MKSMKTNLLKSMNSDMDHILDMTDERPEPTKPKRSEALKVLVLVIALGIALICLRIIWQRLAYARDVIHMQDEQLVSLHTQLWRSTNNPITKP